MPATKSVTSLISLSLDGVVVFVSTCCMSVTRRSYSISTGGRGAPGEEASLLQQVNTDQAERRALECVDQAVNWLRDQLFTTIPWSHHQTLVHRMLEWLTKAVHHSKAIYRRSNSPPETVHHAAVLVRFVHLVVHPKLRNLDLSTLPKVLRDALYKQLSLLTGLHNLNLGSGNGESIRQRSLQGLSHLTSLSSLSLVNDCHNDCLAIIGQNCPSLRFLDISSSGAVTELGTAWLLLCRHLETVNLFQTSQSVAGYAQLMQGLPKLANIGRCDAFGQVMEYIAGHRTGQVTLAITHLHSREMSYEHLQLLVQFCPHTRHVNLYVDEDLGHLLTPLTKLDNLQELKLLACNFYSDRVDRLLMEQGQNLLLLHLEHVDQLDMPALSLISQSCPRLTKLVFFSCDFVTDNRPGGVPCLTEDSGLPLLENLVCVSESSPQIIEFLLVQAKNLLSVQFGSTAWFNDQIVNNVLKRNGLTKLEEVRILRSYDLTMTAVTCLVNCCPRLKVLAEMEGWEGMTGSELARFRQEIKDNNWDLDTDTSWIFTG